VPSIEAVAALPASSISRRSVSSSRNDIVLPCFFKHFPAEMTTQFRRSPHIRLASDEFRQLVFHSHHAKKTRNMAMLEFDQYVHIAFRAEIIALNRAEQ